jgi:hypothetical protein
MSAAREHNCMLARGRLLGQAVCVLARLEPYLRRGAIVLLVLVSGGGDAEADFGALHEAAAAACDAGGIVAGPLSCQDEARPDVAEAPRGAVLVGFDLALGKEGLSGLRPIYRVPDGFYSTRGLGVFAAGTEGSQYVLQLRARPGYAVGAIRLRQADAVRAINLVYRKVRGNRLDLADSYESGWAGHTRVGVEVVLEGHGAAVVGITARDGGDRVRALGLQCLLASQQEDRPSTTTFRPDGTKQTRYAEEAAQESEEEAPSRQAMLVPLVMVGLVVVPVLLIGVWFVAFHGRRSRAGPSPLGSSWNASRPQKSEPAPKTPVIRVRLRR